MAADDDPEHPQEERIKAMLDRLAEILRGLPPDRQKAFREYLDEEIRKEDKHSRDSAEGV